MESKGRRTVLKQLLAGAGMLAGAIAGPARAERNAPLREQLKYHEVSHGRRRCAACIHFQPGSLVTGRGRCELIANDDEISADGACGLWSAN